MVRFPSDAFNATVPMLIALFLLVVQMLVPQPAAAHAAGSGARAATPATGAAVTQLGAGPERTTERSVSGRESRHAAEWLRVPQAPAHVVTARVPSIPRVVPPLDASATRLSVDAAFAASVRVRTLDASHEVSGRGALLPYYPTAPPLQG